MQNLSIILVVYLPPLSTWVGTWSPVNTSIGFVVGKLFKGVILACGWLLFMWCNQFEGIILDPFRDGSHKGTWKRKYDGNQLIDKIILVLDYVMRITKRPTRFQINIFLRNIAICSAAYAFHLNNNLNLKLSIPGRPREHWSVRTTQKPSLSVISSPKNR